MSEQDAKKRIFISVCDPSADAHCANLIKAVNQMSRGSSEKIEWVGVGGEKMENAGCELLENTTKKATMLYNAFSQVGYYYKLIRRINLYLKENVVDLVIVCDSPAFNFHVARAAKKYGEKVLWYIAPQLWAWGGWRIWKLKRRCDKLACILPFEKDWFRCRFIDTTFVGNPIFDDLSIDINNSYKDYSEFDPRNARVALLPGSRKAEIKALWPAMQKIAVRMRQRWPGLTFTVTAVDDESVQLLKKTEIRGFECKYTMDTAEKTSSQSDLALVASGTATLQVAAAGCPMVIMYQSSRILWHLFGQWLIKTRFLSLVNILAKKELVKEFMPYFNSIEPIFGKCSALLNNRNRLIRLSRELVNLVEPLARGKASENAAQMVLEMMQ